MFRISLREVLIVVALANVAIASLKYANEFWLLLVAAVTMIVLFVVLIVAAVDRGSAQAFAIGFALTMISYGFVLMTGQRTTGSGGSVYSKNIEMDQWEGHLPTTRILRYIHNGVGRGEWTDMNGKVIPGYNPNKPVIPNASGGGFFPGVSAHHREIPPREIFMPIGHCWWALALGYAGGHFARFVYLRRLKKQNPSAAQSSS